MSASRKTVRKQPLDCGFVVLNRRGAAQCDRRRRFLPRRRFARQHGERHAADAELLRELFVFDDEVGVRAVVERLFQQFRSMPQVAAMSMSAS